MRIKRYPGKAVDASLSLEQTNAMGILYEANWLQAHESISSVNSEPIQSSINNGYLNDGVSVLSKYQVTLEQIRALEQQKADQGIVKAIKDLNGYKPSTLRRKPRKQYPGWDELIEANESLSPKKAAPPPNPHVQVGNSANHYVLDPTEKRQRPRQMVPVSENCELPPLKGLRRSHTVVYSPKPSSTCSTLDIKDLRKMWKTENQRQVQYQRPKSYHSSEINNEVAQEKVIATQPVRQKIMPPPPPIRHCDTRISNNGKYESIQEPAPTPAQRNNTPAARPRSILRAKSVRVPSVSQQTEQQYVPPMANKTPPKPPPRTNIPGRGNGSQLNKLHSQSQLQLELNKNASRSRLTASTTNLNDPSLQLQTENSFGSLSLHENRCRRQPGSSSSSNSAHNSDDQFSIPRPRLIVPVHTYARKRRTGNLLKDQDIETIRTDDYQDDDHEMSPHRTYDLKSQMKQILSGAVSSTVMRFVCQPLEVLKVRFQVQMEPLSHDVKKKSKYTSLRQAVRLIYKEEGLRGLWKGHNAGQMLSLTYGTAQWWAYEQFHLEFEQIPFTQDRPILNRFISGGLSGAVATFVSMPLDVMRTRLICQDPNGGYKSATSGMPKLLRDEGVTGLYRGMVPALLQIGPLVGANFVFYGMLNDFGFKLFNVQRVKELPTWFLLISGGTSGMIAKVIVYPTDFLKRRLQIQGFQQHRKSFGENIVCDGMLNCTRYTLKHEGIRGFYKGLVPTLLKAGVSTGFYFAVYEKMKQYLLD